MVEEENEVEFECEPHIIIYKEVEEKINWFTHNYEEEISGWLIGEVKDGLIHIKEIIFPHQEVTGGTVDTTGGDLVRLRKEYGDKCLEIIGHWHSHNTMPTFWSTTDEEFMDEHSEQRPFSLFIVSGKEQRHRVKIMLNNPFKINMDNLDYQVWDNNPELSKELEEVIKTKVKKREVVSVSPSRAYYSTNTDNQRGVYDYDRPDWYSTSNNPKEFNELNFDEEITARANDCIGFDDENFTITISNIKKDIAESLIKETKGRKHELFDDDGLCVLKYRSKTKDKAITLVRQIKDILVDIFTEEFYKYGDVESEKKENELEEKLREEMSD